MKKYLKLSVSFLAILTLSIDAFGTSSDGVSHNIGRTGKYVIKANDDPNQKVLITRAMKIAKGEYLSFVDADDYINKQFLEELYNSAIKENADIALGNIIRVENGEKPWLCYKKKLVTNKTDDIFKLLNLPKTCYVWNRIYRRDLIINNSLFFPEGVIYEDVIWSPQVAYKAKKAVCVPNADYYYRYNEKSIVFF